MRYKKCIKNAAFVLATVLVLGTTGCNNANGSKENSSTNAEDSSATDDSKTDATDAEKVTDASESSDSTLKLKKSTYSSLAAVHDPSIIKDGDTYYIFGSHMEAANSSDLWTWTPLLRGSTRITHYSVVSSRVRLSTGLD